MYEFSRAFAANASAAMVMALDVFGFVAGLAVAGLSGSGGGARSGSELSHLIMRNGDVSLAQHQLSYHSGFVK